MIPYFPNDFRRQVDGRRSWNVDRVIAELGTFYAVSAPAEERRRRVLFRE